MPGYGIRPAPDGHGLLPWDWATERLSASHNYWLATTRPGGGPHVMPVWGVWLGDRLYFSTGERSRKARHLAFDSRCVLTTEGAAEAVVVEGDAEPLGDPAEVKGLAEAYQEKYEWDLDPDAGPVFAVRPQVAFGFIEGDLAGSATRWLF